MSAIPSTFKKFILENPPSAEANFDLSSPDSTFKLIENATLSSGSVPEDFVAVKVLYLSHDPTIRNWIQKDQEAAKIYAPPILKGDEIRAFTVCKIVAVNEKSAYKVGDIVNCMASWSQYTLIRESAIFNKIDLSQQLPLYYYLTIFGMTALTAWTGLNVIAKITESDSILVNAASGATGSLVVQLAKKIYNCKKVVGISSSSEKCKFVEGIGADLCLNYNDPDFKTKLTESVGPSGFDVCWDNVGGEILDASLANMAQNGRVVACGAIAGYNNGETATVNNWAIIITKRLTVKGFIVSDHPDTISDAIKTLSTGLSSGKIVFDQSNYTIVDCQGDNFVNIPKTFSKLFGKDKPNGKLLSLVAEE